MLRTRAMSRDERPLSPLALIAGMSGNLAPGAYVTVACVVSLLIGMRTPETGGRPLD